MGISVSEGSLPHKKQAIGEAIGLAQNIFTSIPFIH